MKIKLSLREQRDNPSNECHCEERSDVAISYKKSNYFYKIASLYSQ